MDLYLVKRGVEFLGAAYDKYLNDLRRIIKVKLNVESIIYLCSVSL